MPDQTIQSRPNEARRATEEADQPEGRAGLGSLLAEIGRRAALTEEEWAVFTARDATPAQPVSFE